VSVILKSETMLSMKYAYVPNVSFKILHQLFFVQISRVKFNWNPSITFGDVITGQADGHASCISVHFVQTAHAKLTLHVCL